MSALVQDLLTRRFYQGMPRRQTRPGQSQFAASKIAYLGAVCMFVNGVAMPVLSGASMQAQCTTIGSGNSSLIISAREANVRLVIVDPAANSKPEVVSISYGATIDISVQSSTSGGGALTSTPNTIAQSIRQHAEADRLLRVLPGGTGAGAVVAAAATAIAHIVLGGVAERQIDNQVNVSALTLQPSVVFHQGGYGLQGDATTPPTLLNSVAYFTDDQTVSATADPLALRGPFFAYDNGYYFVDLERVI